MFGFSGESKEASPIHYISALSGPILTWAVASLYIYIETHPVLQMPSYWYEHDILTLVATLPLFLGITILQGEYWAKFPYNGTFMSFVILYGFGAFLYVFFTFGYHFMWVNVMGYYAPMPFHWYISGTNTIVTIYFCNIFRYLTTYLWQLVSK